MRSRAKIGIIFAVLSIPGCAAGTSDEPERRPTAKGSATSDGDPFNVTPPGSGGGRASTQTGKGGASNALGGGAGNASATGTAASGGTAGTAGPSPSAGGTGGSAGIGAGGAGPHPDPALDCPSPTRVPSANGTCVDRVSEFAVATNPTSIVVGSDGKLWFDDGAANRVVRLETDGRVLERCSAPAGPIEREMIAGSGEVLLWYSNPSEQTIRSRTSARIVTGFNLGFAPRGLAVAPDGKLWVTELNRAVYLFDPAAPTPTRWPAAPSNGIITGSDGNQWFPSGAGIISRLTPAGERRDFPIADSWADDIVAGPDGAIWFTDGALNRIGRLEINGTLSKTFDLPVDSGPRRIITGPDGALWFTEAFADKIGRITLKGDITHYPTPSQGGLPWAITVGPDHNLWFTERSSGNVGRLIPDPVE
jgi:virginiamycin B lyase